MSSRFAFIVLSVTVTLLSLYLSYFSPWSLSSMSKFQLANALETLESRVLSFWFEGYKSGEPFPASLMEKWFFAKPEVDQKIRYPLS
jgi:hypothetical protein